MTFKCPNVVNCSTNDMLSTAGSKKRFVTQWPKNDIAAELPRLATDVENTPL